ncbi:MULTISPECIES: hypothetical protein [unclassified Vibrio]|uniref:hypothetical protein n=1 Tax=unclassified Vibrio TaxID=2614977 RepID=UPI0013619163|nr:MULTISPECIES: hypothetical protein [unclassified Vibrio]NAW60117.1 hypothetical protein [Vibrio sp. V36_P2S2PM302]NAX22470.1 hypothetical protein [Vibrio sp. V39_P1S14PM300]NAX26718.1 hypothetical protein [Vibrio sp. V38_P2S17PM301]NAX29290.1 hypothetical protein [Vibrio sp. V37_P2S8PM304]
MRIIKPKQYLEEFWPGSDITKATVVNWIKTGKIPGTTTPTGTYMVIVKDDTSPADKTNELLSFLES